jgi:hypothetical protein
MKNWRFDQLTGKPIIEEDGIDLDWSWPIVVLVSLAFFVLLGAWLAGWVSRTF